MTHPAWGFQAASTTNVAVSVPAAFIALITHSSQQLVDELLRRRAQNLAPRQRDRVPGDLGGDLPIADDLPGDGEHLVDVPLEQEREGIPVARRCRSLQREVMYVGVRRHGRHHTITRRFATTAESRAPAHDPWDQVRGAVFVAGTAFPLLSVSFQLGDVMSTQWENEPFGEVMPECTTAPVFVTTTVPEVTVPVPDQAKFTSTWPLI